MKTWHKIAIGVGAVAVIAAIVNPRPPEASGPAAPGAPAATSAPAAVRGVTMAQYQQLRDGMSYAEAQRILGGPGEELSSNTIGGTRTVMYKWDGHGSFGANMNAMFQNDRLMMKAQHGLR